MSEPFTYRLREGVTVRTTGAACFLVSAYPLRAVKLNSAWAPLLRHLAADRVPDRSLLEWVPAGTPADQVRTFLEHLAAESFLVASEPEAPAELPFFSVIIPVRNRCADLGVCLASLDRLDYPSGRYEVLVVDDASTDDSPRIALQQGARLLRNRRRRGASAARNRAARRARGEIVCFIDSDCMVSPLWLREMAVLFQDPAVAAGGGAVAALATEKALERYEHVQSSLHMGDRPRDSRGADPFFYQPSCNLAVRRDRFLAAGGFNEALVVGEDVDLCWRLVDAGSAIAYRPQAKVFHRHRNRTLAFCRRRFEYGTSESLLQSLHPTRRKVFPLSPVAMSFWLLLSLALLFDLRWSAAAAALWIADALCCRLRANRKGLDLRTMTVLTARTRHYLAALYQLAAFASRYYLVGATAAMLLPGLRPAALPVLGAHIGVALVRYWIKKPRLDVLRFCAFFTLDQLAYQSGVWWGCLRQWFFAPVAPRLRLQAF